MINGKLIAEKWGISPQHANNWRKHPRIEELMQLNPKEYIKYGARWGASGLFVASWPKARFELLKKGAAVTHPRPEEFDLPYECHSRGFSVTDLVTAGEWGLRSSTVRSWASSDKLRTRLWDAILGYEAVKYGVRQE